MKKYSNLKELLAKHKVYNYCPKFDGVGYIYKQGKYFTKHGTDITEVVKSIIPYEDLICVDDTKIAEVRGEITPYFLEKNKVSAAYTAGILHSKPNTKARNKYIFESPLTTLTWYTKSIDGKEDYCGYRKFQSEEHILQVWKKRKEEGDYKIPIDGICFNNGELAWKPDGPCKNVKIKAIEKKVGPKSGRITYIAILTKPVELNDKQIRRVNIYSNEENYKVGQIVDVYLKNNIIAKIRKVEI